MALAGPSNGSSLQHDSLRAHIALSMTLPPCPSRVNIPNTFLGPRVNSCIDKLNETYPPTISTVNSVLMELKAAIQHYIINVRDFCNGEIASKAHIDKKSFNFRSAMYTMELDIHPTLKVLEFCGKYLFANSIISKTPINKTTKNNLTNTITPIISFLENFISVIIKKNSYQDRVKDPIKKLLSALYISNSHFQMYAKDHDLAETSLKKAIEIRSTFSDDYLKQPETQGLVSFNISSLATLYIDTDRIHSALDLLLIEKEALNEKDYAIFEKLTAKFMKKEDYVSAFKCCSEANKLKPSAELTTLANNILESQQAIISDYLTNQMRSYEFTDPHCISIQTSLDVWHQSQKSKLQSLSEKGLFQFEPGKLIIRKITSIQKSDLSKIIYMLINIEAEHHRYLIEQETLNLTKEEPSPSLERIQTQLSELSIACCSTGSSLNSNSESTSNPALSTSSDLAPRVSAPKVKTRGKPSKQKSTRASVAQTKTIPLSDAEKYGFSKALFGNKPFHECRRRSDTNRAFYMVRGEIEHSGKPSVLINKLISLLDDPKIVPHTGEEGFKSVIHEGKPLIIGKILGTKYRLFPRFMQTNATGDIAIEYGTTVKTKNGFGDVKVLRYGPPEAKSATTSKRS